MRVKTIPAIQQEEVIFLLAYMIYIFAIAVSRTCFFLELPIRTDMILKLARYGAYFLCVLKCARWSTYRSGQVLYAAAALIVGVALVFSSSTEVIVVSIIFLGAINTNMKSVLTLYEIVVGALLTVNVIFSLTGISTNYLFDEFTRQRWGLGFNWANIAPISFMFLVFGYLYLRQSRTTWLEYLLLMGIGIWMFVKTDSKFAFLLTAAYLVCCLYNQKLRKHPWALVKKAGKLCVLLPFVIAFVSIMVHFLYNPNVPVWQRLNNLLSNRLWYGYNAIHNYKLSLFGQSIEWVGHSLNQIANNMIISDDFLDCAYIRFLYLDGYVGLALFLSIYALGIYKCVHYGEWHLLTVYLFVLLFCVSEYWIKQIDINPFPLLAVTSFRSPQEGKAPKPIRFQTEVILPQSML